MGLVVTNANSMSDAIDVYTAEPRYDLVTIQIDDGSSLSAYTAAKLIRNYQVTKRPWVVGLSEGEYSSEKAAEAGIDLVVPWPLPVAKKLNLRKNTVSLMSLLPTGRSKQLRKSICLGRGVTIP